MRVRKYSNRDVAALIDIWNESVHEGDVFFDKELPDAWSGEDKFKEQIYCGIAVDFGGNIHGFYVLHPADEENVVKASFAVRKSSRGQKACSDLVNDCLKIAGEKGFKAIYSDTVAEDNEALVHLYEKYGFTRQGTVSEGYELQNGKTAAVSRYGKEL